MDWVGTLFGIEVSMNDIDRSLTGGSKADMGRAGLVPPGTGLGRDKAVGDGAAPVPPGNGIGCDKVNVEGQAQATP